MKKILETKRLVLSEFTVTDAKFILTLLNSAGWLQYIGDRQVHTIAEAEQYILNGPVKNYQAYGFGFWRITLKSSGIVIGMCGLTQRNYLAAPDIGYALLPDYECKGYAFEAAEAVLYFAQQQLLLKQLLATVVADNTRSIHLLKKLGLIYDGALQIPLTDVKLDLYSITLNI